MTGLLLGAAVLIAMGWFALGWVARGQDNRRYAESRLRYLANQAIEDRGAPVGSPTCVDSQRLSAPVVPTVNVYLTAPSVPVWPRPPVVDTAVVNGQPLELR